MISYVSNVVPTVVLVLRQVVTDTLSGRRICHTRRRPFHTVRDLPLSTSPLQVQTWTRHLLQRELHCSQHSGALPRHRMFAYRCLIVSARHNAIVPEQERPTCPASEQR